MSVRMVPYAEREVHTDEGKKLDLRYFLLIRPDHYPFHYGVMVIEGKSKDKAVIPNITTQRRTVCELLDKLVAEAVTPVTLTDVVEDWL